MVDVDAIRREVAGRKHTIEISADWVTPSGRQRSAPIFVTTIRNVFLRQQQIVRASDPGALKEKAEKKLSAWADEEIRRRTREAKEAASEEAEDATQEAQESIEAIRGILAATLAVDDRIKWDALYGRYEFRQFSFRGPPEAPSTPWLPPTPTQSFWAWLFPALKKKWLRECEKVEGDYAEEVRRVQAGHLAAVAQWEIEQMAAMHAYEKEKAAFQEAQRKHNESVRDFRARFEGGDRVAVEEYLRMVFEHSAYPESFPVEHEVAFDPASSTALVDIELPEQGRVPDVEGYKYIPSRHERKPIQMKPKDHDALYDKAIKDTVLRTLHEVFEAVYTPHVQSAVVNVESSLYKRSGTPRWYPCRPCVTSMGRCSTRGPQKGSL